MKQILAKTFIFFFALTFYGFTSKAQYYGYLPKFEKDLQKVDILYQYGNLKASLKYADSIEPLIIKEYGDSNFYYGYFVSQNPAMIYEQLKNFHAAEKEYKRGMLIMEKANGADSFQYAEACLNIGNLYSSNGLLYQSTGYIEKGRRILKKLNLSNSQTFAAGTNNLANVYNKLGNYLKAENLYDTSLQLIIHLASTNIQAAFALFQLYSNYGSLYHKIGDFDKAIYYYHQAYEKIKDGDKTGQQYNTLLNNIGSAFINNGQPDSGLQKLIEAKNNLEPNKTTYQYLYLGIANAIVDALRREKKIDTATRLCEQLISFFQNKTTDIFIPYNFLQSNYASCLLGSHQWKKADSVLSAAIKVMAQNKNYDDAILKSHVLNNLAVVYLHTKNYDGAVSIADSLWAIHEKIFIENYWALPENEKLLLVSAVYNTTMIYAAAYYGMGMNNKTLAKKLFEKQSAYKGMLLQNQNMVMKKIRESNDVQLKQQFEEWKSNTFFLGNQYKLAASKRSKLTDSIAFANDKIEKLLQIKSLTDAAYVTENKSYFDQVKKGLPANECLLEFVRFSAIAPNHGADIIHYGAFVIKKNQDAPQWIYIGKETELTGILGTSISKAINPDTLQQFFTDPRLKKTGLAYTDEKLFALIFKPLLPYLAGIQKINCVSDGLINSLPLQALPINKTAYVGDKFSFRNLLAASNLILDEAQPAMPGSISLWGGINYFKTGSADNDLPTNRSDNNITPAKKYNYPTLKWSDAEVKTIEKNLKENYKTVLFTNTIASEANFKTTASSNPQDIIHLSTHGYAAINKLFMGKENLNEKGSAYTRAQNPLLTCGLVMAGANICNTSSPNDGLLSGYEIANMDLSGTKLIVLSACETGLGSITATEGVFGLPRAFRMAGAKKIMMSLWKVDDKVTANLMIAFYKFLLRGNSFEKALHAAQNEIRKTNPSPYFWAGFEIVE